MVKIARLFVAALVGFVLTSAAHAQLNTSGAVVGDNGSLTIAPGGIGSTELADTFSATTITSDLVGDVTGPGAAAGQLVLKANDTDDFTEAGGPGEVNIGGPVLVWPLLDAIGNGQNATGINISPTAALSGGAPTLIGLKFWPVLAGGSTTPLMAAVDSRVVITATVPNSLSALDTVNAINVSQSATAGVPPFPIHDFVSSPMLQQTANASIMSSLTVGLEAGGTVKANGGDITVADPSQLGYKAITAADNTTERMTATAHGYVTGDGPFYVATGTKLCTAASTPFATCSDAQAGTAALPGGLAARTSYWIIRIDDNTIQLAASYADAIAGNPVLLSSNGTATNVIGPMGTGVAGALLTPGVTAEAGDTATVDSISGLIIGAPRINGAGTTDIGHDYGIYISEQANPDIDFPCAICSVGVSSPVKIAGKMQVGAYSDAGPTETLEVGTDWAMVGDFPDVTTDTKNALTWDGAWSAAGNNGTSRGIYLDPAVTLNPGAGTVGIQAVRLIEGGGSLTLTTDGITNVVSGSLIVATTINQSSATSRAPALWYTFRDQHTTQYTGTGTPGALANVISFMAEPILDNTSSGTLAVTALSAFNSLPHIKETAGTVTLTTLNGFNAQNPTVTGSPAIPNLVGFNAERQTRGSTKNVGVQAFGIATPKVDNTSTCTACTDAHISWNDSSFIRLTGNSAKVVSGIGGGFDGARLTLYNQGAGTLTIDDDDSAGAEDTAASQILTMSGGDKACAGVCVVNLIYDSGASRWVVTEGTTGTLTAMGVPFSGSATCGGASAYMGPFVTGVACNATVTNVDWVVPADITVTGISCGQSTDTTCSMSFTLDKNGSDETSITCTSVNGVACSDTGSVAFVGGDLLAIHLADTGATCTDSVPASCWLDYLQ